MPRGVRLSTIKYHAEIVYISRLILSLAKLQWSRLQWALVVDRILDIFPEVFAIASVPESNIRTYKDVASTVKNYISVIHDREDLVDWIEIEMKVKEVKLILSVVPT